MHFSIIFLILALLGLSSCAPATSGSGLIGVERTVSSPVLLANAREYLGKTLEVGGRIIETENLPEKTVLIVLQHRLGYANKPDPQKTTGARFLFQVQDFLDPAIFRPGRLVTVVGEVVGEEMRPLQQTVYTYPVITGWKIHLWPIAEDLPRRSRFHFGLGVGIGL